MYIHIQYIVYTIYAIVYIHTINKGASKYIKPMLTNIEGKIDSNTIIVGGFNITVISMNKSSRLNINKEMLALNNILNQMDLIDIHRTFHPKAPEYTFFSSAHGTFSRIAHMLGHKTISINVRRLKSSLPTTTLWDYKSTTRRKRTKKLQEIKTHRN